MQRDGAWQFDKKHRERVTKTIGVVALVYQHSVHHARKHGPDNALHNNCLIEQLGPLLWMDHEPFLVDVQVGHHSHGRDVELLLLNLEDVLVCDGSFQILLLGILLTVQDLLLNGVSLIATDHPRHFVSDSFPLLGCSFKNTGFFVSILVASLMMLIRIICLVVGIIVDSGVETQIFDLVGLIVLFLQFPLFNYPRNFHLKDLFLFVVRVKLESQVKRLDGQENKDCLNPESTKHVLSFHVI